MEILRFRKISIFIYLFFLILRFFLFFYFHFSYLFLPSCRDFISSFYTLISFILQFTFIIIPFKISVFRIFLRNLFHFISITEIKFLVL